MPYQNHVTSGSKFMLNLPIYCKLLQSWNAIFLLGQRNLTVLFCQLVGAFLSL